MSDKDKLITLIEDGFPTNIAILFRKNIEDIADYLLANGVIVPPCKVGDKIYQTDGVRIYESEIREIFQDRIATIIYDTDGIAFDERAIGKTVFLTKEDAELKLKEMGE